MDRRKFVLVVLVLAILGGMGWWSYSSGSTSKAAAEAIPIDPGPGATDAGHTSTTKTTKSTPPTSAAAPTTTIAPNPELYATALYRYWTQRDRADAAKLATPAVVTQLFKLLWHKTGGWTAKGCTTAAGSTTCAWTRRHRSLLFHVRDATSSQPVLVDSMQLLVTK